MKKQCILCQGNLPAVLTTVAEAVVDLVHVAKHEVLLFV